MALPSAKRSKACGKGQVIRGLSLCAGAGGLDLGFHIATSAYRTVGYVERDAYAASTLVARMEVEGLDQAPVWDDLTTFKGKPWRRAVDIIHGGYPCQPFSVAGKKLGDKDPRHLWPYIKRIVGDIKPPLCFFENVGGHLRLGFEQVHDDLRSMGFGVKAGLFTAEEVGAPHKRERLFILAYAEGAGKQRKERNLCSPQWRQVVELLKLAQSTDGLMADSNGNGCESAARTLTGKDDPEGWSQCATDTGPRGNGDAAGEFPVQQARPQTGKSRRILSDKTGVLADTTRTGTGQHKLGSRPQPQRGGQDVVDTACLQRQEIKRSKSDGIDAFLVDTNGTRLEGWRADRQQGCNAEQPFPPSPSDRAGWQRLLEYAPHLEPAVCGGSDGLANRVDRLRLCGNGVVPLAAAYAFRTLAAAALRSIEGA